MTGRRDIVHSSRSRVAFLAVLALSVAYIVGSIFGWGGPTAKSWVSTWAGVVTSGAAVGSLLYMWRRTPVGTVRTVRFALCVGAAAWCAGELVQGFTRIVLSRAATSLSFADLFLIVALVPVAVSFACGARRPRRWRPVIRYVLDTYVSAAALFSVGWVFIFARLYRLSGESAGVFLTELSYPILDIVLLCGALPLVLVTPGSRRTAASAVYAALLALTVGDVIETIIRVDGGVSGDLAHAPRIIAYLLVGVVPWLARPAPRPAGDARGAELPPLLSNAIPGLGATLAVLVLMSRSLSGSQHLDPILALAAASAVIVAVVRVVDVGMEAYRLRRAAYAGEEHFEALADNIGDAVVITDLDGVISYSSAGVTATYGYARDNIVGTGVADIVHPEDWPRVRAQLARFLRSKERTVHVSARIVTLDGTWLHTESVVSRSHWPGERNGLLITTRDMSERVALKQQVDHLTFHDGLTGLPNRAYYEERVHEVLARDHGASRDACVFIDLDGFTAVNDSAGHAAGDLLLGQAARRLRATAQIDDTVARWGGDEFAVFVENAGDAQLVVDLAEQLAAAVAAEPFHVAGRDVMLTASIGVAFAEDGSAAGVLIRNADVAMARAKELGGGRVEIFAVHMHADVVRRLELVNDLRRALDDEQFAIEYQPIVDLATSRVTGVEALVRLHRDGAYIGADEFIRPAAESGLIVPLGEWVLREACRQVARWRASAWSVTLSVNLAARQIAAPGFVATVADALEDSGLPGEALTVEVTEEVLVEDADQALERLGELRDLGVRLAIDDFGTGYASLVYLRQLPVDVIKIDPSFVRGLGQDDTLSLLTQTIVRLGHDLGIGVVAEGIERPDQLDLLREMGCAHGQGYLVARPMIADRMESLVHSETTAVSAGG